MSSRRQHHPAMLHCNVAESAVRAVPAATRQLKVETRTA
jgi:hypothetical protein